VKHREPMHEHPLKASSKDEHGDYKKVLHPVVKEHTSNFAKFHHVRKVFADARAARVKDRADTRKKHKENPVVDKASARTAELEDAPNPNMHPSTMTHPSVKKLYTKTLQSHIDKHRADNPGLPKGKVQAGFGKVTMPAVYRHMRAAKYDKKGNLIHSGWDPPSRVPGLRGQPGMTEWHKACTECRDADKARGAK
jgi:hypothetical protein